jgi:hypothetical protein
MATEDNKINDVVISNKLKSAFHLTDQELSEVQAYVSRGLSFKEAVELLNSTPDLQPSGASQADVDMDSRIRKSAGVK